MKLALLSALIVGVTTLLNGCSSACNRSFTADSFRIELSRGACMGKCPVYTATINGVGAVNVDGRMNTPVIGTGQTTVDNATLCSLADALEKMEFFALQDSYNAPVADAPGATLTVTMAGRTKKVTWNITAPPALTAFTATVDTLTVNSPTLRPIPAP